MTHTQNALWLDRQPLLLASASATRAGLLQQAGIAVQCEPAAIDERAIAAPLEHARAPAAKIARHLAIAKARAICAAHPERVVLGADQILIGPDGQLHKPLDRAQAARQLGSLSGQTHRLVSAFAVLRNGKLLQAGHDRADLTMRPLSDAMIARYLDAAGDGVFSSVGGYQLERQGVHLFERIKGDHSTILGLPLLRTLAALRHLGLVAS